MLRGGRAAVARGEGGAGVAREGIEGELGLGGLLGVGVGVGGGGSRRGSLLPLHGRGGLTPPGRGLGVLKIGRAHV